MGLWRFLVCLCTHYYQLGFRVRVGTLIIIVILCLDCVKLLGCRNCLTCVAFAHTRSFKFACFCSAVSNIVLYFRVRKKNSG